MPLRIVRLDSNKGLGPALQAGLLECQHEFVARMDADDSNLPGRFAEQARILREQPEVDLVAGWHEEVAEEGAPTGRMKQTPEHHEAIARALQWRNCISHPTVMFRRERILALGGYADVHFLEDYDLFLRLLGAGARFGAVPKATVRFRVTAAQVRRRGGVRYAVREMRFRYGHFRQGNIPAKVFVPSALLYLAFRLLPSKLKSVMYGFVRNEKTEGSQRFSTNRLQKAA